MANVVIIYVRDDMVDVDRHKWAIQQWCERHGRKALLTISGHQDLPEDSFEIALDIAAQRGAELVVWRDDILPKDWPTRAGNKKVTVKEVLTK